MASDAQQSPDERRWLLLLSSLFAVTLTVPTVVALTRPSAATAVTVAIALGLAAWYAVMFVRRRDKHDDLGAMVVYAAGALAFFVALNVRDEGYFLLLYAFLPQFFGILPRYLAVAGVVGIVTLPPLVAGRVDDVLSGRTAFNLMATVGLGLVITWIIEGLGERSDQQRKIIEELEAAREANDRLLAAARRDAQDRAAVARAGHDLIAATGAEAVAEAIAAHLADHSSRVVGVALLQTTPDAQLTIVASAGALRLPVGSTVPPGRTAGQVRADTDVTVRARSDEGRSTTLLRDRAADEAQLEVVLPLRTTTDTVTPADPDLLWLALRGETPDEVAVRDLSAVATEAALVLSNLRLAAQAAVRGRTAGVLAERQRLAHDIHDTLAQGFTSIVTQLEAAEQALDDDPAAAVAHVSRAKVTARSSLGEARRTVEALRPRALEDAALPEALRDLTERWRAAQAAPIAANVRVDGSLQRTAPSVDDVLLRVAQEALTNIGRHADATSVDLTLSYIDDEVLLDVQDDGVGFDLCTATGHGTTNGHYGLVTMRERMALIGGSLTVESELGEGTTIAARAKAVREEKSDG